MTHSYTISGLTCNNCVEKAAHALRDIPSVTAAIVQIAAPQARITMQQHISLEIFQTALGKAGNFHIGEAETQMSTEIKSIEKVSWLQTYKPILLIFAYIIGVSLLIAFATGNFNGATWMRHFMAGFFLVFSFFKILDLKGFTDSYSTYDIVAKRWRGWAFIYPFLELSLGIAFLVNYLPLLTNIFTALLMTVSLIGVLQSVINKRKIRCACLGAVFNLPMSTLTIVEDSLMAIMSVVTIFTLSI